jgi:hypothetical protein
VEHLYGKLPTVFHSQTKSKENLRITENSKGEEQQTLLATSN